MFVTLTTTPTIEGRRIVEYKGIVFGEVISGVDFVKDFAAGLTNFFGGRSNSYEGELQKAREQALAELQQRQQIFDRRRCQGFLCIRHTAALPIARFG